MTSSFQLRGAMFAPARLARCSPAKSKHGKDTGRVNSSAIRLTEDVAGRRFAAARAGHGSSERTESTRQKGLIVNSTDLCASTNRARARLTGQNGRVDNTKPIVRPAKCRKHKKNGKHHKKRGRRR